MNNFYWLVKREFWEHRGGFLWAPVIVSGIFLTINLLAIIAGEVFSSRMGISIDGQNINMMIQQLQQQGVSVGPVLDLTMYSAATISGVVLIFVVFFYCLGALYDDRRDRSILLWKSLPLTDRNVVLSKVFSAGVLAPVIAVIVGIITAVAMLLMAVITASLHGANAWPLLMQASPFRVAGTLLALIPVNLVWALPTLGWLLLCSSWARSKPFLWAAATPVLAGILVSWLAVLGTPGLSGMWFWDNVVKRLLLGVAPMGWLGHSADIFKHVNSPQDLIDTLTVGHVWAQMAQAQFWAGAIAGVVMIAATIWMRRKRSEV